MLLLLHVLAERVLTELRQTFPKTASVIYKINAIAIKNSRLSDRSPANKHKNNWGKKMSKDSVKTAETQKPSSGGHAKNHNNKRKRDDADKQSQGATSAANKKQKPFNERRNKYDKNKKDKNTGKGGGKGGKEDAKKAAAGTAQKQDREDAFDESIGKMDGQLLADHFLQKAKRHNKDLTAVELSDMSIPGTYATTEIL